MKMIIAIMEEKFLDELTDRLLDRGVRVTKLHSTGGFLSKGNCTLLLGCEASKLGEIKGVFQEVVSPETIRGEKGDVVLRGASLFVIDVEEGRKV